MSAELEAIRDSIRAELSEDVQAIRGIIHNPRERAQARIKAFEALANRGGLPAVSASVSQQLHTTNSPTDLLKIRERLENEQEKIEQRINILRTDLSHNETIAKAVEPLKVLPQAELELEEQNRTPM